MTALDRSRAGLYLMLAAVAAAMVVLRYFDPAISGIFPPCPFRLLTGWYCPGCGSLRAFHQLLCGNLHNAWAMNPLAVACLPFLSYGLASYAHRVVWGTYLPRMFVPALWIRVFCVAVVLFGIARNLSLYPFVLLAPGGIGLN